MVVLVILVQKRHKYLYKNPLSFIFTATTEIKFYLKRIILILVLRLEGSNVVSTGATQELLHMTKPVGVACFRYHASFTI